MLRTKKTSLTPLPPLPRLSGVCAAPGSVPGGGPAAHQRFGGPGRVSAPGGLQAAAAGAQPPGSAAASAPQRQPGRRALRPEGGLRAHPARPSCLSFIFCFKECSVLSFLSFKCVFNPFLILEEYEP